MKLLSVALARTFWVFDPNELNPGGKDFFTHLFPSLIEDYKFKIYPKPGDDFAQGMKFVGGEFVKDDGSVLVVNATLFSDGISAETYSSTRDSEEFLGIALRELPDLGFAYDPEIVRRKMYLSQVNVKCAGTLHTLSAGLIDFAHRLSMAQGTKFELDAIELWPDQTQANKPANFSFQRKIGEPPGSDRYWSQAAVQTETHLELLGELEAILMKS
jgi:hypothetical protein